MKSHFVKHENLEQNDDRDIELTVTDLVIPRIRINLTFFYDYVIDEEKLEWALARTLSRYPELAGR